MLHPYLQPLASTSQIITLATVPENRCRVSWPQEGNTDERNVGHVTLARRRGGWNAGVHFFPTPSL
jgi:hypothetical protein